MTTSGYDEPEMARWRRLQQTQVDLRMALTNAADDEERSALRRRLASTRDALAEIENRSGSTRSEESDDEPLDGGGDADFDSLLESLLTEESPSGLGGGDGSQQFIWAVLVGAVLLTSTYMLSLVLVARPESGYLTVWDGWIYHAALIVPAVLSGLRAVTDRHNRLAWWLVTLGILLYTGGTLLYTYHDQNLDPIPFPAWSDVLYLESTLALVVALALVTHRNLPGVSRAARLNGLVIGLAAAAIAVAFWFDTILDQSGSTAAVMVALAYPLFDLVFIVIVLSGLSVVAYRPSPSVTAFILGAAVWAIGDVVFLRQLANDSYVPGTVLEASWVVGILFFGAAPWLPQYRTDRAPAKTTGGVALIPWAAALASLGVIGWSVSGDVPAMAVWLAMAAILAVLGRIAVSLGELRKANEAFSQAWLGELAGLSERPQLRSAGESTGPVADQERPNWLVVGAIAVAAVVGAAALLWNPGGDQSTDEDDAIDTVGVAAPQTTEVVPETSTETATPATASELRTSSLQDDLDRLLSFTPVVFDTGQRDLSDNNRRVLNNVAALLQSSPGVPVKVIGFTDGSGSVETNLEVSIARATAVHDYLVANGVAAPDLIVEGRGKADASGVADLSGLERRVVFEVVAPGGAQAAPLADLRVGIVTFSPGNDLASSQSMVDSVNTLVDERQGLTVTVVDDTILVDEAAEALRTMASEGYHLVIAHDPQLGAAVATLAQEFPEVTFAWGPASQAPPLPNVYTYTVASEQGGYVLGALAASLSDSGVLGVVGPIEAGDSLGYISGFEAGAVAERPDVSVQISYTGSFLDASLAAEAAQAEITAGADVLTGSGPASTGAATVAVRNERLWIGNQVDQSPIGPGHVVASQLYHWDVVLRQVLADIDAGVPNGRVVVGDLANGGLSVELNPGYGIDPALSQRVSELQAAVASGSVVPPSS
ncbi:MAG: BMP family ABC transporter substrate-binding protein [Acidimicrobiales bacterium]